MNLLAALLLVMAPAGAADAAARIDQILSGPVARRALWGIKAVELETGRVLYQHNADKLFVPASNTKLFTTAMALARLGPDHRWITRIAADGPPDEEGRITGDLVLVGGGDPNLSSRVLPYEKKSQFRPDRLEAIEELAAEAVAAGVREVRGNIVGDDSEYVWDRYAPTWALEDIGNEDGPPVTALAVHDNLLTLRVRPDASIEWDTPVPYYRVDNRLRVSVNGGRVHVRREPGDRTIHVWGEVGPPNGGRVYFVAIDDPALYAAMALRDALARRGVILTGEAVSRHRLPWDAGNARAYPYVLASRSSMPLAEDLIVTNKVSQNLHAELLARATARRRRGIGSFEASRLEMKAFLDEIGVRPQDYVLQDGSGLSRQNLVSPNAVIALLTRLWESSNREVWLQSLPLGGVDGTLSGQFVSSPLAEQVRAKTGTLTHVSALSGYLEPAGKTVAFSVLVNNYAGEAAGIRALIDRICLAISGKQ